MAQNPVVSQIGTTGLISSTALGTYEHLVWQPLLVMTFLSVVMIFYGNTRLKIGKHVLATTAWRRKDKSD